MERGEKTGRSVVGGDGHGDLSLGAVMDFVDLSSSPVRKISRYSLSPHAWAIPCSTMIWLKFLAHPIPIRL